MKSLLYDAAWERRFETMPSCEAREGARHLPHGAAKVAEAARVAREVRAVEAGWRWHAQGRAPLAFREQGRTRPRGRVGGLATIPSVCVVHVRVHAHVHAVAASVPEPQGGLSDCVGVWMEGRGGWSGRALRLPELCCAPEPTGDGA